MEQITKLYIWKSNRSFINADIWTVSKVHDVLIKRKWNKLKSVYKLNNLSNINDIELYYENWEKINLPENIIKNLSIYLSTQNNINKLLWNNKYFDCTSFVHLLNWIPFNDKFEEKNWNLENIPWEESLSIWDNLLNWIIETRNWNMFLRWDHIHFSIYLWEWLYLWKWWINWNLIVYNMESLKKMYPFNILFKATPKKKTN